MNRRAVMRRWYPWLAAGVVIALLTSTLALSRAADNSQKTSPGIMQNMKNLQEKMSQEFSKTWNELWQDKNTKNPSETSVAEASADLREQPDSYTLRLTLPDRTLDKVGITLSGDTLNIVAPAEGKTGRYEQSIYLSDLAPGTKPQIEREQKNNLIVVTLPKSPEVAAATPPPTPAAPLSAWDAWDQDVLNQMNQMQQQMDDTFNQAMAQNGNLPGFNGFFNQVRLDSSFDVQDQGKNYIVRAYLPDQDLKNVHVTLDGQTLKIEANAQSTQQDNGGMKVSQSSQYSQMLTLPGPVQADKMTVDQKTNMLVVTLPKA